MKVAVWPAPRIVNAFPVTKNVVYVPARTRIVSPACAAAIAGEDR